MPKSYIATIRRTTVEVFTLSVLADDAEEAEHKAKTEPLQVWMRPARKEITETVEEIVETSP